MEKRKENLAAVGILAAIYFIAAKLGLTLAFVHPSATAVWPTTGIALAALLILGYRAWPAILLGAFFVNLTTAGSVLTSLGVATGNTLEALVGAYLVNRYAGGREAFYSAQNTFKFSILAGLLSTTVAATFGVTSLSRWLCQLGQLWIHLVDLVARGCSWGGSDSWRDLPNSWP
ncbi:MAG: MASE1 domain-containing protein [Candidatus Acidiferrales bacterium]